MKRKRVYWSFIIVISSIITLSTIWYMHIRQKPVMLNDTILNNLLRLLENTEYEVITNYELRATAYEELKRRIKKGGEKLITESIEILIHDSDSESRRKAMLVLTFVDFTVKQVELLSEKAETDCIIWSFLQLRKKSSDDHLIEGYPGIDIEKLPLFLETVKLYGNRLGSIFDDSERILDLRILDLDGNGTEEILIRSSIYGVNTGQSIIRILSPGQEDILELSGGNPFRLRIVLLQNHFLSPVIIAVPDFYLECLAGSAVIYSGTIAIKFDLHCYSVGHLDKLGEVYIPLWKNL